MTYWSALPFLWGCVCGFLLVTDEPRMKKGIAAAWVVGLLLMPELFR